MWSTCLRVVALVVPVGGLEATVVQVVMAALGVLVATVVVVPGVMAALVVEEGQAVPTPSLGQHASTLVAFHKATQA